MNRGSLLIFSAEVTPFLISPGNLPTPPPPSLCSLKFQFLSDGKQLPKNGPHVHLNSIKYGFKEVFGVWHFTSQIVKKCIKFLFSQKVIEKPSAYTSDRDITHSASFPCHQRTTKWGQVCQLLFLFFIQSENESPVSSVYYFIPQLKSRRYLEQIP